MSNLFLKLWLLCGTLDALYASGVTLMRSGSLGETWRGVAAGPLGDGAAGWGPAGVAAGVTIHYALMAAMVAVGLWLARKTPLGEVAPWKAGTLYGLILYGVMYGIVIPARFGAPFPNPDKVKVAIWLLPHILLVGVPIFWLARKAMNTSPSV